MRRPSLIAAALLAVGAAVVAALLALPSRPARTPKSTTYYVSPTGNDSARGTSPRKAWRTVARVNRAPLAPGDHVLFRGGSTFGDATLIPDGSGSSDAPIVFGSFGQGDARLANQHGAVWFDGKNDLVFEGLRLTTNGGSNAVFAGSDGAGSSDITLSHSVVENTAGPGVIAGSGDDQNWTISHNVIARTGDSGIIALGSGHTISDNTIRDTGLNRAIGYPRHGIYSKGSDQTISGNDISHDVGGQAISLRYHGADVYGNNIHDTSFAIGFFDEDPAGPPQGSSQVHDNHLTQITGWALFYSGQSDPNGNPPSVDFSFTDNHVQLDGASEAVDVSEAGDANVTIAKNVFIGRYGRALAAGPHTDEHDDVWSGAAYGVPTGSGDTTQAPAGAGVG